MPISSLSSAPSPELAPDVEAQSAAAAPHTITHRHLERAESYFRTLRQLRCPPGEALLVLHEYLSHGSTTGYEKALKEFAATPAHLPRPLSYRPPDRQGSRPSFPELVLALEQRGVHCSLNIGEPLDLFYSPSFSGPLNRGHEQLPKGCLTVSTPAPQVGNVAWKPRWYAQVVDPIVHALKPGQTALIYDINDGVQLIGLDERGEQFGFSSKAYWNEANPHAWRVMRGRQLSTYRDAACGPDFGPTRWAIVSPRPAPSPAGAGLNA